MTAVRWIVEHPGEPPVGGWVEYPNEAAARIHAGTAGTVWALVTPDAVRVLEAGRAWHAAREGYPSEEWSADLTDEPLFDAVNRLAQQEPK